MRYYPYSLGPIFFMCTVPFLLIFLMLKGPTPKTPAEMEEMAQEAAKEKDAAAQKAWRDQEEKEKAQAVKQKEMTKEWEWKEKYEAMNAMQRKAEVGKICPVNVGMNNPTSVDGAKRSPRSIDQIINGRCSGSQAKALVRSAPEGEQAGLEKMLRVNGDKQQRNEEASVKASVVCQDGTKMRCGENSQRLGLQGCCSGHGGI